jgi:hypothetical protein
MLHQPGEVNNFKLQSVGPNQVIAASGGSLPDSIQAIKKAFNGPLFGLSAFRQFVVYKIVPKPTGKSDKLPVDSKTGAVVSAHDPQHWLDAATAEAIAAAWGPQYGVGFVFTEQDPFWFLDIDACLVDGAWSPLAIGLCGSFPGCAQEVSGSGKGLHIIGRGIPPAHGCRNQALGLEFYHTGRFVALTGINAQGDCMTDASAILPALVANYFQADAVVPGSTSDWTEGPCAGWYGPIDDKELIRRAMNSRSTASAFNGKASFADLWLANEQALAVSYPTATAGEPYGASEADAGLAQHLGNDCERMRRIMLLPANKLLRDKYEREDYLPRTIRRAVARQSEVYEDKRKPAALSPVTGSLTTPDGTPSEFTPDDFIAHLPTHRYFNRSNRESYSVDAVNGHLRRFKDGHCQGFKPAAWLDMFRAVQQMSWQPGYPEIIEGMVAVDGELRPDPKGRIYNLFRPSDAIASEGDPSIWLNHVRYLYPDDADHIVNWCAYRIQHPGEKINHAVVLGGTHGIGKDWSLEPLRYGVGTGNFEDVEYKDLFGNYTEWAERTLLVVNEARDTGGVDRYAFYENSKRLIAAPPNTLPCRKMYLGRYYVPNVMAVAITSNNKLNGLYIHPEDRRYYVAWSKAEKPAKGYFKPLWEWMRKGGGKESVLGYLQRLDIAGFDPMAEPPKTEAWHDIVDAGRNPEETAWSDTLEGVKVATVKEIIAAANFAGNNELAATLIGPKNARKIPHLLSSIGFEILRNPHAKDSRWVIGGKRETLYAHRDVPISEAIAIANKRVSDGSSMAVIR